MYTQIFSKLTPGCIVILIDQSGSMDEGFNGAKPIASDPMTRKDRACALAVNRVLRELALASQKGAIISPRCDIGIIRYGGDVVESAFGGRLQGRGLVSIAEVAVHPKRIDTISEKVRDGAGGLVEQAVPFPVWVDPVASGGTPMAQALQLVTQMLKDWVAVHRNSPPPVVINVTDGAPDSRDQAEAAANALCALETSDGQVLLFNAHISSLRGGAILLPADAVGLPDEFAKFLFQISSVLPAPYVTKALGVGFAATETSRGFVYNADADALVRLLEFGSLPAPAR